MTQTKELFQSLDSLQNKTVAKADFDMFLVRFEEFTLQMKDQMDFTRNLAVSCSNFMEKYMPIYI